MDLVHAAEAAPCSMKSQDNMAAERRTAARGAAGQPQGFALPAPNGYLEFKQWFEKMERR